jgi:hypothetical protein
VKPVVGWAGEVGDWPDTERSLEMGVISDIFGVVDREAAIRSRRNRFNSAVAPLLLAQVVERGESVGWFIFGGAMAVLAVGVVIVILARARHRRDDLENRIAVRSEATALVEPPMPAPKRRPEVTFIDLPADDSRELIDLRHQPEAMVDRRRSPLSSHLDDIAQPQTFVDLPGSESQRDPVIDLTEESVDLTEERQEAAPKSDPWA